MILTDCWAVLLSEPGAPFGHKRIGSGSIAWALMENPKTTANSSDKRFFPARSVDTDNLLSDPSVIQTKDRLPGSRDRMLALNVFQAGSLPTQAAQVVKLRAPHFGRTHQFNLIQYARALRENTLHALPKTDLAHRETCLRPATARDDHALKCLQALFVTFFNLHLHSDSVPGRELRKVGALSLGTKLFHY